MNAGYPNSSSWFANQQESTGSSSVRVASIVAAGLLSFAVMSGTGASADDLGQLRKLQAGNSTISNPIKDCTVETSPLRTSAENLGRIRTIFSLAVSDLGKTFNVSRQTIYNWLNGEQPTPEHTAKLRDLALAADTIADAGIPISGILLKRKLIEGKNIFEFVQSGGSATDAAQLLAQIFKREAEQKQRLSARFAGRSTSKSSADSDIMAANDVV